MWREPGWLGARRLRMNTAETGAEVSLPVRRYMVVERFKPGKLSEVYRRFGERGRMMPEGLRYVDSWITADLTMCFQLMEAADAALFEEWTRNWEDLVEFEIVETVSSAEARRRVLGG